MADKKTVFLFDVDNTLLNNDRVTADLKHHLDKEVGHDRAQRYWEFFEKIRSELGTSSEGTQYWATRVRPAV